MTTPAKILASALAPIKGDYVDKLLTQGLVARRAGLKLGHVTKALNARPLSASDHLRLCAAIQIDPGTGADDGPVHEPGDFDFKLLGAGVTMRRIQLGHDKSIRKTAEAIGVVHSTFLKIERGEVTAIASVLAACRYIGLSPFHYQKPPCFPCKSHLTTLKEQEDLIRDHFEGRA